MLALFFATPVALPTAIAVNLGLFLASRHGRTILGLVSGGLAGGVATLAFPIYMQPGTPAIDWHRATLLPAATSLVAIMLWMVGRALVGIFRYSSRHWTPSSSTSNTKVAPGGITPPAPRAP